MSIFKKSLNYLTKYRTDERNSSRQNGLKFMVIFICQCTIIPKFHSAERSADKNPTPCSKLYHILPKIPVQNTRKVCICKCQICRNSLLFVEDKLWKSPSAPPKTTRNTRTSTTEQRGHHLAKFHFTKRSSFHEFFYSFKTVHFRFRWSLQGHQS